MSKKNHQSKPQNSPPQLSDKDRQLALIKACYEDREATINGISYQFNNMTHKSRRTVFSYVTHVAKDLERHDFWFMETPDFERVEKLINECVSVSGNLLCKLDSHWEEHPESYFQFIAIAMQVISYPFSKGSNTA